MSEFFEFIKEKFFQKRGAVILTVFLLFTAVLIGRLYYLQIMNGEKYQSSYNLLTERTESLPATRGNIYDRNGVLLAYNRLSYSVTIVDSGSYESTKKKNALLNEELYQIISNLERCGDEIDNDFGISMISDGNYRFNSSGTSLLRFRADVFGHSLAHDLSYNKTGGFDEKTVSADDIMKYLYEKRYSISDQYEESMRYKICVVRYAMWLHQFQKYIDTVIATDVNERSVAYIKENQATLTGVNVREDSMRQYDYAECMSNLIGYTGTISAEEYNALIEADPNNKNIYSLTDVVGKSGIEQYLNEQLSGRKGNETVYVDYVGNEIEKASYNAPVPGNSAYMSIDVKLQSDVYDLLEQEVAGIVCSKLKDIREYKLDPEKDASDILIPVYDAYVSFLKNGLISVKKMGDENASDIEKEVYNKLARKKDETLSNLKNDLLDEEAEVYGNLSDEYQSYSTYIIKDLKSKNVLVSEAIDESDETQKQWQDQKLSVGEYLKYCISKDWIDINAYETGKKYADSNEMYLNLVDYIIQSLTDDREFDRLMNEYAVREDIVTGNELCAILYDQGILEYNEEDRQDVLSGNVSSYDFIKDKLKSLEITPGQLALDPCSASCVIIDPRDGSLLACVSYPGYDTNKLANKVQSDYYNYLVTSGASPLYNHATQQSTAPGSTFKLVTATAGLAEHVIDTETIIEDEGIFEKVSNRPRCWIYPSNHEEEKLSEAIKDSCNYFFYEVGWRLAGSENYNDRNGIARIQEYASLFGLDRKTGIETDEKTPHIATQYPVMAAIGQSDNNFTTISLARYVTALSTSGDVYRLSLLRSITSPDGSVLQTFGSEKESHVDVLDQTGWDAIHLGMRQVVEDLKTFDNFPVECSGKTGTAQESRVRPNHSLFVGYAPSQSPSLSLAVRIPFGYTSHNAADCAKRIFGVAFGYEEYKKQVGTEAFDLSTNNRTED